jgi:hypothetical protein
MEVVAPTLNGAFCDRALLKLNVSEKQVYLSPDIVEETFTDAAADDTGKREQIVEWNRPRSIWEPKLLWGAALAVLIGNPDFL